MVTQSDTGYLQSLGVAFLARHLLCLSEELVDDVETYLKARQFDTPSRSLSMMMLLGEEAQMGVTQISERLQRSHPLVIDCLRQLEELGLVEFLADERDKRRRLVALTARGKAEAKRLRRELPRIEAAYRSLSDEVGVDLWALIGRIQQSLAKKRFLERLNHPKTGAR